MRRRVVRRSRKVRPSRRKNFDGLGSVLLLLSACYQPPDVPILNGAPSDPPPPCAPPRTERVACVIDGDTLDIGHCGSGGVRVRLLGLSAPELHGAPTPECWAEQAARALATATEGRSVRLTFDARCHDTWGRQLAYLWLDDAEHIDDAAARDLRADMGPLEALMVNEWLAAAGHAQVFEPERFGELIWQERLESAQARAEAKAEGWWGACLSGSG